MSEYSRYEKAKDDAEKKGCVILVPSAREAFVDIDDGPSLEIFEANIARLKEIELLSHKRHRSPSGTEGRYHVVVTFERDITPIERILFQALLGSDRVREFLSYQRHVRGDATPTLFFETKGGKYDPTPKTASLEDPFA